jgi:hypothetical protein
MSWRLSRFRTGELVQIRSKEEILATLTPDGRIDGMPFMPEMLQFCGQEVRVGSVAHKTCETAKRTYQGRRLESTVHLADLRCDGSAHGGCQAACRLFWRDEWLRPADEAVKTTTTPQTPMSSRCDEASLVAAAQRVRGVEANGLRYSCQATELYEATKPLRWWDPRQYILDITTGNHSTGAVVRALWLGAMRAWLRNTPRGYRLVKRLRETTHRYLVGGELPDIQGAVPAGQPTPTGRIDLKPGERVRIKPKSEILETIREDNNKNRGLSFDQEMVRYCGSVATVHSSVTNIIDEGTGEMVSMKQPCIILDGVVCMGEYSECRLMCPRQLPTFWRELWLERVEVLNTQAADPACGARSLPPHATHPHPPKAMPYAGRESESAGMERSG